MTLLFCCALFLALFLDLTTTYGSKLFRANVSIILTSLMCPQKTMKAIIMSGMGDNTKMSRTASKLSADFLGYFVAGESLLAIFFIVLSVVCSIFLCYFSQMLFPFDRLFFSESINRAAKEARLSNRGHGSDSFVDVRVSHLRRVLPQLLCDF